MTPSEQVLLMQRNQNYDQLTQALIKILELEAEIKKLKEEDVPD